MTKEIKILLGNRKFVYLWTSQILSQLSIQVMNFLIIVRLFERTGSTIATSLIWIAYALPAIMVGPFAAAWVDFLDRRLVLIASNLLQFMVLLTYSLTFKQYFFLSYAVVLAYSLFNQFYVPAEAASLPTLVSKKSLAQANGLFFLTQQAAIILGFGLGGVLNETIGFKFTFFVLSVFLFVAFLSVSFLPNLKSTASSGKKLDIDIGEFFAHIAEGYQFIKGNLSILMPFILLASIHVAISIISVNLPVMAKDIIGISASLGGIVIVIPAGLGALGAILLIPRFLKKARKKTLIERSLILVTASLWLVIFLVPEFAKGFKIAVSIPLFALAGASLVGIIIPCQTFLQEKTPKALMGRVFGNFWFIATVATIFPVLFSATISELFGVKMLFFLIGLACLVGYVYSIKKGQSILEERQVESGNV